jgi:hypothetical protein
MISVMTSPELVVLPGRSSGSEIALTPGGGMEKMMVSSQKSTTSDRRLDEVCCDIIGSASFLRRIEQRNFPRFQRLLFQL